MRDLCWARFIFSFSSYSRNAPMFSIARSLSCFCSYILIKEYRYVTKSKPKKFGVRATS